LWQNNNKKEVDNLQIDAILYITVRKKGNKMNFKYQAINIASNALSGIALVGAVFMFTAVPAKAADSSDVVAGIIFGLVLGQHAERNQQQQQQPVYREQRTERYDNRDYGHRSDRHVRNDDHRKVCHVEYRRATHGRDVRYEYDCRGRLINTTR
tara:strand:+ start:302 stop:763 length:462 start_codon:yes stop_codon:yes gene_type:complete